jgi:hypothetical protein
MHLLPLSLGRLAEHADRTPPQPRYATQSVFLRVNADNTFEAVATDTKSLAHVTGPCAGDPAEFPEIPEFAARPDGGVSALVPAEFWKRSFAWAKKLTPMSRMTKPWLRCVAVRLGQSETSFAATNDVSPWCDFAANNEGRFPNYAEVIRGVEQKPPGGRASVDPRRFAELLRTAAEFCPDPTAPSVDVEWRGPRTPVVVRAGKADGLQFLGLLMPLFTGVPPTPVATDAERDPVAALERRCAELEAEKNALARQVEELKAGLGRR